MNPPFTLYLGDCLEVMHTLAENSIDSIVTDPPYGLSKEPDMAEVLRHWLAGDDYQHKGAGFMGKSWDSFVPGPAVWRECLRVLKPRELYRAQALANARMPGDRIRKKLGLGPVTFEQFIARHGIRLPALRSKT